MLTKSTQDCFNPFFPCQPEHKIQSSDGPLQLSLELVPKMLEALVKHWVQRAFVISFKVSLYGSPG